jgi:hypothetical protein
MMEAHRMDNKSRGAWVAAICAMIVASIGVGGWFWRGGEMAGAMVSVAKSVETLQSRQDHIEQVGTSGLKAHIDLANERNNAIERRLKLMEDSIAGLNVMQADVREIKVRLQLMEQLMRGDTTKTTTKGTGW